MVSSNKWFFTLGIVVLMSGGCAHVPPPPESTRILPAGQEMSLSGRVSVHQDEENFSGQFQWVSRNGEDDILLSDPLGQGVARIVRNERETTLQLPDGRSQSAPDADALTEKLLGFRLPLGGMTYWINARPSPSSPNQLVYNDQHQVERINQDGWKIDYLSYLGQRPRKVLITRQAMEIKLVVDHWGP